MSVQGSKAHSSSEVSLLSLLHRVLLIIQMLLGQPKIDDEDLLEILAQHKVGSLNVPVYEASVMDFLYSLQHLNEQLHSNIQTIMGLQVLTHFGQVVAQQVHHDEVLFAVFHEIIDVANVFEAFQADKNVIFKNQNALVFIFFLYFECNVLFQDLIIGLINETEGTLAQLLF